MNQPQNKTYDIIVGIPTYNEEDSIKNTLEKLDKGLVEYYPSCRSLIVNVDSDSKDRTKQVFLSTETETTKMTISGGSTPRGKGSNIFLLLQLSKKLHAKYMATIDADVTTISEKWPKLLLDPIIHNKADFVTPVYTRNRYEGNTTNHFCFPLMYAWFGCVIAQPIGGDFAMSRKFLDYILKQSKPQSAYLYGIDIFLSANAVGGNFRIKEVHLGRKIHKPSFDKIIPMFQQVARTMLCVLSQYKTRQKLSYQRIKPKKSKRTDDFIRKPDKLKILFLRNYAFRDLGQSSVKEIQKYFGVSPEEIRSILKTKLLVPENQWIKILARLISYVSQNPISYKTSSKIATLVAPFFFLRVLSYFEELDKNPKTDHANTIVYRQA